MGRTYNRRRFLQNSAAWAATIPTLPGLNSKFTPVVAEPTSNDPDALKGAFLNPPDAARPWVYWFVSDGNLTREGITADFEALHRAGIRGILYMEVDQFVPKGPARFLSPQWRELLKHAMTEATRLGITMNMNNDGGWCGSGGPWITPDLSMQVVMYSETTIQGPQHFTGTLAQPKTNANYYRDIAVLAFPSSAGSKRMAECSPTMTYGPDHAPFDFAKLIDGNGGTVVVIPLAPKGKPQFINIQFPEAFTAESLTIALDSWSSVLHADLEVSDDGMNYRPVRTFTVIWPMSTLNFQKVAARYFRVHIPAQGPWFYNEYRNGFRFGTIELNSEPRIEEIYSKASYMRHDDYHAEPAIPPRALLMRDQVIDVTAKMDSQGNFTWDVPEGKWTVVRFGHTSTGKDNHPAPLESRGLECDKLSKKAIEVHFAGLIGKLLADQATVGAKTLTMTHIDSWEVGSQNWTQGFREEFEKRCAYDLMTYFPALTGRVVDSAEVSERFLWDLRRVVCDMVIENYAGHLRDICHQHGLTLSIEGYSAGPLDEVPYAGQADVPMSEFWTGQPAANWNKEMASAGHVYGHPVIAAESFTADPQDGRWQNHPYRLKALGDKSFTQGINRFVIHRYSAQPWLNRAPGMTMGPYGIHYERTNTWFEQSRAWVDYLSRCQALLQSGRFVADIACLGTEDAPNSFPKREGMQPPLPEGCDFDDLPVEALNKASVQDGRLVLPSGMSYRILVLPPSRTMRPAALARIRELVAAGLPVVGPRPVASPSLVDYPYCDGELQQLAAELWGECDGVAITDHAYGQGNVVWGRNLADVLRGLNTPPDFDCHQTSIGEEIRFIHRTVGNDEVYFVASGVPEARRFLCTFRAKGKRPELWWPDSGRIEPVAVYDETLDGTVIPLSLGPHGSVFVVLRSPGAANPDQVVSIRCDGVEITGLAAKPAPEIQLQEQGPAVQIRAPGQYSIEVSQPGSYLLRTVADRVLKAQVESIPSPLTIEGPWELTFPKGLGAPERITLPQLVPWSEHPNPGVKYFSGTATYHRKFEVPAAQLKPQHVLSLDLGRVAVIAEVKLNGHSMGILWKPPFSVEITDVLRAGANDLEVSVVNLWVNRLIGDEQLPDDCEWKPQSGGAVLASYPPWLLDNKPRPTARVAFTVWKHWNKDDPLMESGLLGPLRINTRIRAEAR